MNTPTEPYKGQHQELESARRLEAVFASAIDGIVTINESGIIDVVNPAAARMFGYTESELQGQNVSMLMPAPYEQEHDSYISHYLQTGKKRVIGIGREVVGLRKDGSTFPFKLSISEVNMGGRRLFTGIVHDMSEIRHVEEKLRRLNKLLEQKVRQRTDQVTEAINKLLQANIELKKEIEDRKKVEDALNQSQAELRKSLNKQKDLNDLKSKFVTLASHEFRTPLTTILSSASLISRYENADQQSKRVRHIERIKSSVHNLNSILEDFLSMGKLEEGKILPHPEMADLHSICSEVISDAAEMTGRIINLDCKEGLTAFMDKNMFRNILTNLLSNAWKYSPADSQIEVCLKRKENEVVLDVKDYGMGIPKAEQIHLFDRFFRASNANDIQGTGLGLNIVHSYVDLMSGMIDFKSDEGKGTTFTVRIPDETMSQ